MTTQANPPRPRNGPETFSDPLTTAEETRVLLFNRVSWGAVLAGVMVALVTQLILNLIGIGIGAASFDPTSNANPSGTTFSIAAGIWWALSGIVAALAGGYTAGRLSGQPAETSGSWHGLTAWAVTTLLVFYLLSTSVGAIVGGAFRTLGNVAGSATQALGTSAQTAAQMAAPALARSPDPFASIDEFDPQRERRNRPRCVAGCRNFRRARGLDERPGGPGGSPRARGASAGQSSEHSCRAGADSGCPVRAAISTGRRPGQAAGNSGGGCDSNRGFPRGALRRHRSSVRRACSLVWRPHGRARPFRTLRHAKAAATELKLLGVENVSPRQEADVYGSRRRARS